MSRWSDRITLGPARRRRQVARRMRALDRQYAAWASGAGGNGRSGRRELDLHGRIALAVTVVALAGLVFVPGVLPPQVRALVGLGPHRVADLPAASGSGAYAFIGHQPGDASAPVGYDPCHPVQVLINPRGAPPGAVALVREAMDEVSKATGLVLRYEGTTADRPHWDSPSVPVFVGRPQSRPVLVSWALDSEVPQLAGDVAGIGGSVAVTERDGVRRYVTGGATLDAAAFADLAAAPTGAAEMKAIVLHELGHVVGLAHVEDPGELMDAENLGLLDFGPGDLRGLAEVGAGSCG